MLLRRVREQPGSWAWFAKGGILGGLRAWSGRKLRLRIVPLTKGEAVFDVRLDMNCTRRHNGDQVLVFAARCKV